MIYIFTLILQTALAASPIVPKVDLGFWNGNSELQGGNNCYNYSTNRVTNSFAQPGEASNKMYENLTCKDVLKAAASDLGLKKTKFFPFNGKDDDTLIALVVAPGEDFHWYRRGDDGMWSHKPGSLEATIKDESDHTISDPEKADRGFYSDFCGYFRVKNYRYQDNEQDGGFVRIGSMTDLPPPPKESEVVVMMYSGRPNPRYPLKDLIQDASAREQLQKMGEQLAVLPMSLLARTKMPSHLGYAGIKIEDREGLLFPKGSEILVTDKEAYFKAHPNGPAVSFAITAPLQLERQLFQKFQTR